MKKAQEFTIIIENENYISLRTGKKNGRKVATPLWFIVFPEQPQTLYAFTNQRSAKVKRIENYPRGEIALCNFKGDVRSDWIASEIIANTTNSLLSRVMKKMYRKYFLQILIIEILSRISNRRSDWIILQISY